METLREISGKRARFRAKTSFLMYLISETINEAKRSLVEELC